MVKILHLSDIHLGSGFAHGAVNPHTGLNTRLEDFGESLRLALDRAIAEPVDLVLFGGDAFPDATPPPYIQEIFAAQFRRLVDAQIPTVLLVGNHDQHTQGQGGASLCIYRTLGVPGFIVGDRLETHTITTRSGPIQVITLPWLTHSTLLTRPEMEGRSLGDVNQQLLDRLALALEGEIRQLDLEIPTVLLAHAMVDTAKYGAERYLAVGKGFTLPLSLLTRPCFDYVALGHVHRHQVLCTDPPVVYAGSVDRVDFSEEKEEKGYVFIEIGAESQLRSDPAQNPDLEIEPELNVRPDREPDPELEIGPEPEVSPPSAQDPDPGIDPEPIDPEPIDKDEDPEPEPRVTQFQFCPLPVRPFRTLKVNLTEKPDPQALLLQTLAKAELEDAIVRLIYRVTASQLAAIDLNPLREALSVTHSYTIQPELVNPTAAPRLPELGEGQDLSPLDALEAYVASRSELADIATDLLEAAQVLWLGEAEPRSGQRKAAELAKTTVQETGDRYGVETAGTDASDKTQLRLL